MVADDILLLKLIQSKDEHAFKYLFDMYFVPLCRYAHLYLNNTQEGEELVLDIYMYLWEHGNQINLTLSLKAYLFQAVRNRCLNCLRDKKKMLPLDEANDIINDETASMLEMEELNLLVQEAIYALPDKCQKVFRLSREGSKTNQEIANEMNVSVKTVEAQITKALKRIKNFLDDKYAYLF
ncbi:RNA polymerase sigma-70 factor [Bacteroides muris (ex Afrizal et al. 2022)]|jgi:RNA polymerase sigma-70 factor (ECF subfamily)|nr:RNA polymerase sigma-70 factor [Bacteroides muris (ex Afrizal et al. 2022)]TGY09187.1 RNA polymerase sigma-70 factor [Bacteroides muris (ex Afrizal et al. 2022)]